MNKKYIGRSGGQNLVEAKELYFHQNIQAISNVHSASNSMKTTAFSLAVKWPGQTV